jgi:hypothetical protein
LLALALPSTPPQLPHVLTSGAEIYFFSVVLVVVSAEEIYCEAGREQRTQFRKESRNIILVLPAAYGDGFKEGAALKYLAQFLLVRKAGG